MKITQAEFTTSAAGPSGYPPAVLPEVAFVGRSNVGKSTLINALLNRKGLAKTSSTPGKTQLINFFRINNRFCLVDLPGYGFAKAPKAEQAKWRDRIEGYLKNRETLRLVVVLVDVRHPPTEKDRQMVAWLTHFKRPCLLVATKADKLSRSQVHKQMFGITRETGLKPIPVSARLRDGLPPLWKAISESLLTESA
ncbi:MAG: ribosome biogenesis GTP-binding protein YihA/YsxC [Leptospirillia bacterium]